MIATLAGFAAFVLMMFVFCTMHPLGSRQKYAAMGLGDSAHVFHPLQRVEDHPAPDVEALTPRLWNVNGGWKPRRVAPEERPPFGAACGPLLGGGQASSVSAVLLARLGL